jgi:hypothetical protein
LRDRDNTQHMVDDEAQIPLIPEFLDQLRRHTSAGAAGQPQGDRTGGQPTDLGKGGFKKLHVLYEGWRARSCRGHRSSTEGLEARRDKRIGWMFEVTRRHETTTMWNHLANLRRGTGEPLRREWWWLGSGINTVAGRDVHDSAERCPGHLIQRCRNGLDRGCRARGWNEFEGGDVLGWML